MLSVTTERSILQYQVEMTPAELLLTRKCLRRLLVIDRDGQEENSWTKEPLSIEELAMLRMLTIRLANIADVG